MTLINARDIAAQLGVSVRKLEQMIERGELPPYIRVGRVRKWRAQDIDAWIDRLFVDSTNLLPRSDKTLTAHP